MDAQLTRALVVVASLLVGPVHAQPTSDAVAAAEQLFEQARGEMEKGNVVAACGLFEASRKLDPQRGTLLNLAACFEKANLLASAWGRFKELEVLSTKAGDEARAAIARERIAALEPRLPKLSIRAPAGVAVSRDGSPVDPMLFGTAIFVDPGEHTIEAHAPGHRPFTTKLALREAEIQEITIPALEKLPSPPPKPVEPPVSIVVRDDDPGKGRRVVGAVVAGGGVVSLATGIGFGISARSTYRSAFDDGLCFEASKQCYGEGQERTDRARERATVSNLFAGIGVALVATGAVIYFTAPRGTDVAVVPTSGGGAVSIGGRW